VVGKGRGDVRLGLKTNWEWDGVWEHFERGREWNTSTTCKKKGGSDHVSSVHSCNNLSSYQAEATQTP
jgi:hypothetical protein